MVSYKWFRNSSIIHKEKTKAINVQWVSSSNFFYQNININFKYLCKNEFISYISSCFIRSEWSLRRAIYLNRTGVQLGNPKSACCCYGNSGQLWELFTTKFKSQIKRGFTKVATRAGRLREWSQGELLWLYLDYLFPIIWMQGRQTSWISHN